MLTVGKEGYLAEYAVSEEDKAATEQARQAIRGRPEDPTNVLKDLDVAGPQVR